MSIAEKASSGKIKWSPRDRLSVHKMIVLRIKSNNYKLLVMIVKTKCVFCTENLGYNIPVLK